MHLLLDRSSSFVNPSILGVLGNPLPYPLKWRIMGLKRQPHIWIAILLLLFCCAAPAMAFFTTWAEMMNAAKIAHANRDFESAKKFLLLAIKEAEADKEDGEQAQTYLWLGRVYESGSEWVPAEQSLRKGIEHSKLAKALDPEILIGLHHELEHCLHKLGRHEEINHLRASDLAAATLIRRPFNPHPMMRGRELFADKNYKRAEPFLRRALEDYRAANDTEVPQVMLCVDMLYQIYRDGREFEKCEELIAVVMSDLKKRRDFGSNYSLKAANLYFYQSSLLELQGKTTEAETAANSGFSIYKNLKTSPEVIEATFFRWDLTGKVKEASRLREYYEKIAERKPVVQKSGWTE